MFILSGQSYEDDQPQPQCSNTTEECPEPLPLEECLELNQDILTILREDSSKEKSFSDNLHKDIASRWQHILLNGLQKENRSELLKAYLPPENCPQMRAPKLNLEIKAALSELNNKKDVYCQNKQNQLASCLSALGKALNMILVNNQDDKSQEIIKSLSDAGRLLCDYHFKESQSRRYAVINVINKETKDTIKNTKLDDFLFGSDLAEHLKSSKAITKSGQELRPTTIGNRPPPKSVAIAGPSSVARRGTLNARGAPPQTAVQTRAHPIPRRRPAAPARDRQNYNSKTTQRHRGRRH